MGESDGKPSFWTTIPGILTGVAAVLTAGTGLFLALNHSRDSASPGDHTTQPGISAPATGSSSQPTSNPVTSGSASTPVPTPMAKVTKGFVMLTSRKGEVTQLSVASFRHNYTDKSIELTSGQSILFEKIKVIDFLDQNRDLQESTVKVTLTDGRVIPGTLKTGYEFKGESDSGPFNIWLYDVKQVAFPPAN